MDELTGMVFHSAEREVERLEKQLDEARQEADALRRQLEHAQDAIEFGNATNLAAKTVMLDMRQQRDAARQEAADLRRQVEHANNWRDSAILEANEARAEAAELRRQLTAALETIVALRLRLSLDNPAYKQTPDEGEG